MKVHIVLAHPEAKSFNAHLARTTERTLGAAVWQTTMSDLYGMDFDPREGPHHYTSRRDAGYFNAMAEQRFNAEHGSTPADVRAEAQRLLAADLVAVHFPVWWFGMPAILKGWIDRVFANGLMHDIAQRYDAGLCRGKRAIVCATTGAGHHTCAHNGKEGDTRLHLWPMLYAFRYLGFDVYEPEVFHGVSRAAFDEARAGGADTPALYTERWEAALKTLPSRPCVPYNPDGAFDDTERLVAGAPVYSPFIRHDPDPVPR